MTLLANRSVRLILTSLMLAAAPAHAGDAGRTWNPGEGVPGTDGPVCTLLDVDSGNGAVLYAAGNFHVAGDQVAGRVARWNGATWEAIGAFDAQIEALAVYEGDLIVGGWFTRVDDVDVSRIARFDGNSWQAMSSGINGAVSALEVLDGTLFAGGSFSQAGGVAAANIARWNGASWSGAGSGFNGGVRTLKEWNGALVAGGEFTLSGSLSVERIALWDGQDWQALGQGLRFGAVEALEVFEDDLIAGGSFTQAGGDPVQKVARWDGETWSSIGAGIEGRGTVASLAIFQDQLVVGGDFREARGAPGDSIARWDGETWRPLGPGLNSGRVIAMVSAMVTHDGELVVGGDFVTAGLIGATNVARWDGVEWRSLGSGMNNDLLILTTYQNELYAGGAFDRAGDAASPYIARRSGGRWRPVGDGIGTGFLSGSVDAMLAFNGDLIIGGRFSEVSGQPMNNIARWNGVEWRDLGHGVDGGVEALAEYDGELIVAGWFTTAGGAPANRIARWDGEEWRPLAQGLDNLSRAERAYAIIVWRDDLIAAGQFTMAGGRTANNIARWDGAQWHPLGEGTDDAVWDLAVFDEDLIAAGSFTTAGGVTANGVARWDGQQWTPLGEGMQSDFNMVVRDLFVFDGNLFAGGRFQAAGIADAPSIARWDGQSWSPLEAGVGRFNPQSEVLTMTVWNGDLVVGGDFATAGDHASGNWATWGLPGVAAPLTDFTFAFGSHLSGGLPNLEESDDLFLRGRSEYGFSAIEANILELIIGAETDVAAPDSLDLTIESKINNPNGLARVRLKNWTSGAFEQVHQYAIGTTETVETITGLDAANRVRDPGGGDGRIELSIKQTAVVTFSVIGFDASFDHVEIAVR